MSKFDRVKLAEQAKSTKAEIILRERRLDALTALQWFAQYANGRPGEEVLEGGPTLIAYQTAGAGEVAPYVQRAAKLFLQPILDEAIRLAQAEAQEPDPAQPGVPK